MLSKISVCPNRLLSAAALGASLLGALTFGSVAQASGGLRPLQAAMMQCAGGYHPDRQGNCQPDTPQVDMRCPDGYLATPWPDPSGYRCIPY